jgi:enoyl-[acyl-carrier-protein] reductase (NADH)
VARPWPAATRWTCGSRRRRASTAITNATASRSRAAAQTFVGRNGELPDLAGTAIYLASRASDYVTSQTIFVDGGISAG